MAPKKLVNKRTGTIWDFTEDLATNPDLEPYYGEEITTETAAAAAEVDDGSGGDDYDVDPDTGELVKVKPAEPAVSVDESSAAKKGKK